MSEIDDDALMKDLADFGVEEKPTGRSALEQRILAGFEEIERFVEQHGRPPQHGEERDIFERLYAVRLDRLRQSPECRAVLKGADPRGLLGAAPDGAMPTQDEPDDAELQAALGDLAADDDVTKLVHVRSNEDRKAAEEVAHREPCADFEKFRPVFDQVQKELNEKLRQTRSFIQERDKIEVGGLFVLHGQKVLVAGMGEIIEKDFDREDRRLRLIFDNGTESNMLLRSLQRALLKVPNSRCILPLDFVEAPLFSDTEEDGDVSSGHIYVLRSKSNDPFIAQFRSTLHKIGVTGGDVKTRIANAKKDATYLLADVEIVQTYKLVDLSRKKAEELLHKFLAPGRMDVTLKDRFGFDVAPREWFIVPLPVIDEAVQKLRDGTLHKFRYDPEAARVIPR